MRTTARHWGAVAVLAFLASGIGAAPDDGEMTARDAFERVLERIRRPERLSVDAFFPDELAAERLPAKVYGSSAIPQWRSDLAIELGRARLEGVREKGDRAVARMRRRSGETFELPLRRVDGTWRCDAAQVFSLPELVHVRHPFERSLSRTIRLQARGGDPFCTREDCEGRHASITVRTGPRSRSDPRGSADYLGSEFSFSCASGDEDDHRNDVQVWYDRECGRLHLRSRTGEAGLVNVRSVTELDAIPVDVTWAGSIVPAASQVLVIRCRREKPPPLGYDFYVAFEVTAVVDDFVDLRWGILARGFRAPKSVRDRRANPAGARDGVDGHCGRACAHAPRRGPTTPGGRSGETLDRDGADIVFANGAALSDADFEDLLDLVTSRMAATDDPEVRGRLLDGVRDVGPRVVPPLVRRLGSDRPGTRAAAIDLLRHATGHDFGFVAAATEPERADALETWRDWERLSRGRLRVDPESGRIVISAP